MPSITVVTTFHPEGYTKYGKRFLESFAARVDKRIKLVVYAENCKPDNPDPSRIEILDAKESLPKLNAFKERWKDDPKANGTPPPEIKARRPRDWMKAFKWDAVRFANKTYAVFDAWEKSKDWIVWMDADSYIHSPWSYKDFVELLPENAYITYVGRGKGSQTWPECGFYGMNKNHPVCHEFMKDFERFYEDADNGLFLLEEWHDSYIFGHILNKYKEFQSHDYSAEMYLREAKTGGGGHPLINGPLGKFMDHMKGGRKTKGKSDAKDIMVNRTEDYWNQ
jgi:glycosyltransferase involved in cell wall biosynthesis